MQCLVWFHKDTDLVRKWHSERTVLHLQYCLNDSKNYNDLGLQCLKESENSWESEWVTWAVTVPVYKEGEKTGFSNHQGISHINLVQNVYPALF
jgi:hypothetical protein